MATYVVSAAGELGVPFGALLEGGYDLEALAASVGATLEAFADESREPESVEREELTERAAALVNQHWSVS
jgi:acetoin utilization deacetylase AcuC-like enzyme